MMYDILSFYQAENVDGAIAALNDNPESILISGGTDVLIKLRAGEYNKSALVSIHGLKELTGVEKLADGTVVIKSCTCFADIAKDPIVRDFLPALAAAADQVGGPQIRNVATIGGNICNGAVSADSAPVLLAYNAVLEFKDEKGIVNIPIGEFYTGPGKTVRNHTQILTAIKISKTDYECFGAHYIKFGARNAMEIATVGCAANVRLSEDRTVIDDLRIAFGVAAPTPVRCPRTEAEMSGMPVCSDTLALIGDGVLREVNPRDSLRASKVFRLQLIRELSMRAVKSAVENAGGVIDA